LPERTSGGFMPKTENEQRRHMLLLAKQHHGHVIWKNWILLLLLCHIG